MNILVLSDHYPPKYTGNYEIRCQETVAALRALGHRVTVLTTGRGQKNRPSDKGVYRLLHLGDWYHPVRGTAYLFKQLKRAVVFRKNARIVSWMIKKIRPDLVYVWQLYEVSLKPLDAVARAGIPYAFDAADYSLMEWKDYYDARHSPVKKAFRWFVTGLWSMNHIRFSHVRHISRQMERTFRQAGVWAEENIVIPCAVTAPKTNQPHKAGKQSEQSLKLLFAGRIVPDKGVHVAIGAVKEIQARIPQRTVQLDVIGPGDREYLKTLRQLIAKEGLENNVCLLDMLPRETMLERYGRYHVVLVPSLWQEPFGVVILEAMNAGVPVVASDVGGIPGIIENGTNGLLVPPGDCGALAEAVVSLARNEKLCTRIRENAKKDVAVKYQEKEICRKVERFLRKAAGIALPGETMK